MTKATAPRQRRRGDDRDHVNFGESAYIRLKDAIQAGVFKPGSRIRESDMAQWLAMSRTPVREALNRLGTDGLVVVAPRRGMIIAELDHQAVMELYFMREVLESAAAGLAARHASEAEILAIESLLESEAGLADTMAMAAHNRVFHGAIHRAAHNRYLLRSLNALRDAMTLLGPSTLGIAGRFAAAHREHQAIVAAIRSHDAAAAEAAARTHILSAQRVRLTFLNQAALAQNQHV